MSEFAVRKPIAVLMICIGLVALGVISITRIPMQLLPPMVSPEFTIITQFTGATPEEVESQLTIPIERALSTVSGLVKTQSFSERERSEIRIRFHSSIDFIETISNIRDKLETVSMPEGASKPKIIRFQANTEPLLRYAIVKTNKGISEFELQKLIQETLIRKLESVEGVALTTLLGAHQKQVHIEVDPIAIQTYEINLSSIPEVIQGRNKSYPAGEIQFEGHKISVRFGQGIRSTEELGNLILKREGVKTLKLKDVAKIHETVTKPNVRTHLQGQESLVIEVRKEAEANAVKVSENVKKVVRDFSEEYSDKLQGLILFDEGKEIETAVNGVSDAVINGGILAAIVIFIMLQTGWPTFVITLSIPLSLMLTLILMYFTGISFNLMSLAGLALGVGMLVDNSTVVLESINGEKLLLDDAKQSAIWGTRKVTGAIVASTLTQIAVFGPLAFVEGMIGQMFRDVAATVSFSLMASMFVALIVIPMLSSLETKPRISDGAFNKKFDIILELIKARDLRIYAGGWFSFIYDYYKKSWAIFLICISETVNFILKNALFLFETVRPVISQYGSSFLFPVFTKASTFLLKFEQYLSKKIPQVMAHSKPTIKFTVLATVVALIILANKGAELFPDEGVNRLTFEIEFPQGQVLEVTDSQTKLIEEKLLKVVGVHTIASVVGERGSHYTRLLVGIPNTNIAPIEKQIQNILSHIPGISFNRIKEGLITQEKPIQVEIYHDELKTLKEQTQRAATLLGNTEGLADLETNIKSEIPEVRIEFSKDRLNWYGLEAQNFVSSMKTMIMGQNAGLLQWKGEEIPVQVRAPASYFDSVNKLRFFGVSHENRKVYLSQLSQIEESRVMGTIQRMNRKRMASIKANLNKTDLETASHKIQKSIEKEFHDKPITWKMGGQDEERKKSQRSLVFAVFLSIFLIYLLLASQFENLIQPIVILCAVPLSISGVALFLTLFNMNMSAMVFVGFILLVGMSINTSIVMVDFANQLLIDGKPIREAITEATIRRVKPIIVTTASNVLGLVPMALSMDQGSAMQRPLAVTLIGGLISSTVLTLIVVPIIYDRLTKKENSHVQPA